MYSTSFDLHRELESGEQLLFSQVTLEEERPLRPVQAIFYSPLGETIERRNAMLQIPELQMGQSEKILDNHILCSHHIVLLGFLFLQIPTLAFLTLLSFRAQFMRSLL